MWAGLSGRSSVRAVLERLARSKKSRYNARMTVPTDTLLDAARVSPAWPLEEARKLVARLETHPKDEVLFSTGYGPSGLPHIGTFGEVARTTMVRHAFQTLTQGHVKTRLIAFSDDMDGLRKVPDNVPNRDMLMAHLGKPLTRIPDPFGDEHPSFGAHNNARLRAFLDTFGFDYEFASSTDYYTCGRFDAALLHMLARYDAVMAIMLPSLRSERAATYSPFLPIHPRTGIVMQVPLDSHDAAAGTIAWTDPATREAFVTPVTGGHCKLQWKPDWAMRWYALGVDYEMAGKDLIDSVKLSGRIVRALDGTPPEGFNYELFLDENGQKISKSRGNGLTIDEWLTYASPESLSVFMYGRPTAAKRLFFDVIPRAVDEYQSFLSAYPRQAWRERLGNPVWHLHAGVPPTPETIGAGETLSFSMLLNLASVANSVDPAVLWGFLQRYAPDASPLTHPRLDAMVRYATAYFRDFVRPAKRFRAPDEDERGVLERLATLLGRLPADSSRKPCRSPCTISRVACRAIRTLPPKGRRPTVRACPTTSSTCSTKCCWARIAGRASARLPRSTASTIRVGWSRRRCGGSLPLPRHRTISARLRHRSRRRPERTVTRARCGRKLRGGGPRAWRPVAENPVSNIRSNCFAAAAFLAIASAAGAAEGPFSSLAGSWSGGGTINMSNGATERLRCKADYAVGAGGASARQELRCASDSYRVDIQSTVASNGSGLTGTWTETSRGVSGNISGRVSDGAINAQVAGPGFGAGLNIGTRQNSQTISIRVQGADVQSVSLNLKRN